MNLYSDWHYLNLATWVARPSFHDIAEHMRIEETYIFPLLSSDVRDALMKDHEAVRQQMAVGRLPPPDVMQAHEQKEQVLFGKLGL